MRQRQALTLCLSLWPGWGRDTSERTHPCSQAELSHKSRPGVEQVLLIWTPSSSAPLVRKEGYGRECWFLKGNRGGLGPERADRC